MHLEYANMLFFQSEHCSFMLKGILLCAANTPADTAATVSFLQVWADDKDHSEIEQISMLIHD